MLQESSFTLSPDAGRYAISYNTLLSRMERLSFGVELILASIAEHVRQKRRLLEIPSAFATSIPDCAFMPPFLRNIQGLVVRL